MKRNWLFWTALVTILVIAVIVVSTGDPAPNKDSSKITTDLAVAAAQDLYQKKAEEGIDFSSGPCLTNDLMPGWVADIVHTPKQEIDNLEQNQCPAYIEGRASHFVELDPSGNLVRVR